MSDNDRLKAGHERNRLKALPPPGKAPYGYRRGKDRYILDRGTAPVVKDFFERFLLTGSLRGAVRYLEKRYGKKISVSTGRNWLVNPVYRGDLRYKNGDIIPDTHAPLVSRSEAAGIDRLLRNNSKLPPRTASACRSLVGLVVCGDCRSPMTVTSVKTARKDYLYLRPTACPRNCSSLPYNEVLERTIDRICRDLPRAIGGITQPDLNGIKQQINAEIDNKKNILEQLPHLLVTGILDNESLNLRSYNLKKEIFALRDKLDKLPPDSLKIIATEVSYSRFWLDLSESERRFYFREFIKQIQVYPDNSCRDIKIIFVF